MQLDHFQAPPIWLPDMNKKEINAKVTELLSGNTEKSEVFARLSGQGIKDSQLAYLIASYADPALCMQHERKVNLLVTLISIHAVIVFLIGFGIGAKSGSDAKWLIGGLGASILILFAWGFHTHRVGAYNAWILLSIIQLPKSFNGFTANPLASTIGISVSIGMLLYVWHVREQLFPDFTFLTPRKLRGRYVFLS